MSIAIRIVKSRETKGNFYWVSGVDWAEGCSPEGTLAVIEEKESKGEQL